MAKPNPYVQNNKDTREQMVLKHAGLIKRIVSRIAARLPSGVERDELYQAGMIGLLDAIDKFDESKDVQFKTYAEFRIKGAVIDELRSMDWIPRSVRSAGHQLEDAYRRASTKLGREPNDSEMAKELDMSLKEYQEFISKARPIPLISLDDYRGEDSEDSTNILEVLADPNVDDPFQMAETSDLRSSLAEAITQLSEQEQLVLSLYYDEELNLKEIGEVLGLTESRVSQIRTKTIIKLRSHLKRAIAA